MTWLPDDPERMFEARSLVYEMSGIPIPDQMRYRNREWMTMYEASIKRYRQKIELAAMSRR